MTTAVLALVVVLLAPACDSFSSGTSVDSGPVADPADQSAGRFQGRVGDGGGEIVADSGFRPESHGFGFENYGKLLPDGSAATNLTPADVRTMFGDAVCRDATPTRCDLIPEAETWLEETNAAMSLGHCYGLAVASSLLWKRTITPSTFGALESSELDIDDNENLQRQIAYQWATQLLDSVRSKAVLDTPNKVLAALRRALVPNATETYTIVLWKPDGTGGHAVTPYAIEDRGEGRFSVLIYDNNWPTQTRMMAFDTKANRWSYDAAINPDVPDDLYEGTAKTRNLALFPESPGLGPQPCPFCGRRSPNGGQAAGAAAAAAAAPTSASTPGASPTAQIFLRGSSRRHADLLITDDAGRRLGFVDGTLVEEIPGARVDRLLANQNWRSGAESRFVVPADRRYEITLVEPVRGREDVDTIVVVGPAFAVSVRDIPVRLGDLRSLTVDPNGENLTYRTSRRHTAVIHISASDAAASYGFDIQGVSQAPGSGVRVHLPVDAGTLTIDNKGSGLDSKVKLTMRRYDGDGVQVFEPPAIPLAGDGTAELRYGGFTGAVKDRVPLVLTRGGRTTTTLLTNDAIPSRT